MITPEKDSKIKKSLKPKLQIMR